jgi:hypothetical protein
MYYLDRNLKIIYNYSLVKWFVKKEGLSFLKVVFQVHAI